MNKLIYTLFIGACLVFSQVSFAREYVDEKDIPQWGRAAAVKLQESKVMTGFGDGTFRPNKLLNRAEAVTLLLRMKKIDPDQSLQVSHFKDVPANAWFTPAVVAATNNDWIKGYPDNTFRPGATLNKAEWATLVYRAFDLEQDAPNAGFKDVPTNVWFARPAFALNKNKLLRRNGEFFEPTKAISRIDAAWIMAKILDMPRIIGTSKKNDFSRYTRIDSRRTAIKPRNFNANKQGISIEKQELRFTALPTEKNTAVHRSSDWKLLGQVEVANSLDDPVNLHFMDFKLRFGKSSLGPPESFMIKLEGNGFSSEKQVARGGSIAFTGINVRIENDDAKNFDVYVKPNQEEFFFPRTGNGELSIFQADASMISSFKKENPDRQATLKFAPVGFKNRKLQEFNFRP